MIDDMTTLMTDMLREMNIENMIMKSYNHNNFLMIVLFIKINTIINRIAKLANTYYILSTIVYITYMISSMI